MVNFSFKVQRRMKNESNVENFQQKNAIRSKNVFYFRFVFDEEKMKFFFISLLEMKFYLPDFLGFISMKRFVNSSQRFFSTVQPYAAVENPTENLPKFLSNDLFRDPKKRVLELYMPHRSISYEDELKLKQRQFESRIQNVAKTLFYDRGLDPSIRKLIRSNDVNLCPIRKIQPTTKENVEYLTSCVADLGKTRDGDFALGLPNRSLQNEIQNENRQQMLVLPIDDVEIYKKRDRLIVRHYSEFLEKEIKEISNLEKVLHHWRPIRIFTNEKDEKLVVIGYFDRKSNHFVEMDKAKERLEKYFNEGPGRECQIDFLFFERRVQRWPLIVNDSTFEMLINRKKTTFHYDMFGMKFHVNLQSIGIENLDGLEKIFGETLKNSLCEQSSSIFIHHFSDLGFLPMAVAQNVDISYGLDPSRAAIETSLRTRENYPHLENVQFELCSNRSQLESIFSQVEKQRKRNSSLTFVFGPSRNEIERADLRQNKNLLNILRENPSIDRLIFISRGTTGAVLHLLYSLSASESSSQKISGSPFKPVLIIPFDSNPRSSFSPDFVMIYDRE